MLTALKAFGPDVIFLDIEMEADTGFDAARYLQREYPDIPYIFLTGHAQYALEGYEYTPLDFLVKPVSALRLERALVKVAQRMEKQAAAKKDSDAEIRIALQCEKGMEVIPLEDILCFEKVGRRVFLVSTRGEPIAVHYSLSALESMLAEHRFFRCHQSFLVSLRAVAGVYTDVVSTIKVLTLRGSDRAIPISRRAYTDLLTALEQQGILFV